MTADDLLDIAADLVRRETARPRQASLKRAVSTAYYALFHALAHECVSQTVGWRFRSPDYWNAVTPIYRAVDHGTARTIFRRVVSDTTSSSDLRTLAQAFIDMQAARIRADYDPKPAFYREDTAHWWISQREPSHCFGLCRTTQNVFWSFNSSPDSADPLPSSSAPLP